VNSLSEHAKKELVDALQGKESGVFVINGKLFSIEVENDNEEIIEDLSGNLAKEIEEYPELKASLSRCKDNPDMKRYSGSELKFKRNEKRK
jgi:hypothetical protein